MSLNCHNCNRQYELGKRQPFTLRCGHAHCAECLRTMGRCQRNTCRIQCPTCTVSTPYDDKLTVEEQFVPHVYLLGQLVINQQELRSVPLYSEANLWLEREWAVTEFIQPLPHPPLRDYQRCKECGLQEASLKCVQCDVFFCADCFKLAHSASNVFRAHEVVSIESLEVPDVAETRAQLKEHVAKLRSTIKTNAHTEKCVGDRLSPLYNNISSVTAKVKSTFLDLHTSLQRRELCLLEDVAMAAKSRVDPLLQARAGLQNGVLAAVSTLKAAQAALKDDTALRERGRGLLEEMAAVKVIPDLLQHPEPIRFTVEPGLQELTVGKVVCEGVGESSSPLPPSLLTNGYASDVSMESLRLSLLQPPRPSSRRGTGSRRASPSPRPPSSGKHGLSATPRGRSASPAVEKMAGAAQSKSSSPYLPTAPPRPASRPSPGRSQTPAAPGGTAEHTAPSSGPTKAVTEPPIELMQAYVSHVVSPDEFYIHCTSDMNKLDWVQSEANRTARHQRILTHSELRKGVQCMARFSQDDVWYRAAVETLSADGQTPLVYFLDFGNSESLPLDRLVALPTGLASEHPLVQRCCLHRLQPFRTDTRMAPLSWGSRAISTFKDMMVATELTVMVYLKEPDGLLHVDLSSPRLQSVSLQLVGLGLARRAKPGAVWRESGSIPDLELTGTDMEVHTSNAVSPSDFYLQLAAAMSDIQRLSGRLSGDVYRGVSTVVAAPVKGMVCSAEWEGEWYRGIVTDVSDAGVKVFYVDFGNTELVEQCYSIGPEHCVLEKQAIHCTMAGLAPSAGLEGGKGEGERWSDEAVYRFSGLIADDPAPLLMRVCGRGVSPLPVELFDIEAQHSVGELLLREGLAWTKSSDALSEETTANPSVIVAAAAAVPRACYPPPVLPELKATIQINVMAMTESPAEFHVHVASEATSQTLAALERVREPETLLQEEGRGGGGGGGGGGLMVGELALCHFHGDSKWHRVEVRELKRGGCYEVQYVDYGNIAEVDACAVARLPRELASLPALALKCGLVGVCPVGGAGAWPPESARFFYSLMGNRFVEAVVEGLPAAEGGSVKLSIPSVSTRLVAVSSGSLRLLN